MFNQVDVSELAKTIRVPTLVIQAKHDAAVLFDNGRQTAAHIPGARFTIIDSKNHVLMRAEPAWQYFWDEFYRFLEVGRESSAAEGAASAEEKVWSQLTSREREVMRLLAEGKSNLQISQKLVLSEKTVRNYVSSIYEKLHINGRGELIVLARKLGLTTEK